MARRGSKLDAAGMEREERNRLRKSPIGGYYTAAEWPQVGTRGARKQKLFGEIGKRIGDRSPSTLVDAAMLQLEPTNQRSWRRVLYMAEATIQSYLRTEDATLGDSVVDAANSMPVKELALEDDPQEAPFAQVQLFPWGPVSVINGLRSHHAAIFAQVCQALYGAESGSKGVARSLAQLRFVYCILHHIAQQLNLEEFISPDFSDFDKRDLRLSKSERAREAVQLSKAQWAEFLDKCGLDASDVAGLLYEAPVRPDETWHFLDYPCNHAPVVQLDEGFVIVNVASLPFAALQLLWNSNSPDVRVEIADLVRESLDGEVEAYFERIGNPAIWKGSAGMLVECDSSSTLMVLPIVDLESHPGGFKIPLDDRVKECLKHIPQGVTQYAVVLVDSSIDCPALILNRSTTGERFVGHATLNYEMLNPVFDQIGRDPMFFLYYAIDLQVFTGHFMGWESMDPPEILADYIIRKGFPLPEPELSIHLIQVIAASYLHNESERLARRRFFQHPFNKKWTACISRGRDQEYGIYRSETDPLQVVLTRAPKPLWIEPAGEGKGGKLHELAPSIQDALCYWLSKWVEKMEGAPAWDDFPADGVLVFLMVTDQCVIMDPREWTEMNRPPHASVAPVSGEHSNLMAGIIQLGSPDFLAKRVNDYEHFMATEFLYMLRQALGFETDDQSLMQFTIDSQQSPFERRLLAGITTVGHSLTPVPDAPSFSRWSNYNHKQLRAAILLHLYDLGFPTEVKAKEAAEFLRGLHAMLLNQVIKTIKSLGAGNVLYSTYTMVEALMAERERAKVSLTALSVNGDAEDDSYAAAHEIVAFVDKSATSARWLVHTAGQLAEDVGAMIPTTELDMLLHLANLCQEVGVMRDAYLEKQERTAYVLHGDEAFQSKGGDYSLALSDAKKLSTVKENRWGKERIEEYWPDQEPPFEVQASDLTEPQTASAYKPEFGVAYEEFMRGMALLAGTLDEHADVTVDEWDTLVKRTAKKASLPVETIERIATAFTQKEGFDSGLDGTSGPWRPLLPNSLLRRPIVRLANNHVCVGPRLMDASLYQFIHLVSEGMYPAESKPMKHAMQKARNRHTKAFEEAVAEYINEQPGWIAKTGFPPGTFGAPNNLGDYDVLALHFTGHLVAIECKAYSIALGPRRLASEWKELSKGSGGKPGTLDKHQNRLDWIKGHLAKVQSHLDWILDNVHVHGAVVTEKHTPTRIWKKTSMPILSFDELQMCIEDEIPPNDWRSAAVLHPA